jgi:hypothetical protein
MVPEIKIQDMSERFTRNIIKVKKILIHFFILFPVSLFSQTEQIITFPDIPLLGYGDVTYTLDAVASSGLAVRYASSDATVASVSGNTVTIRKAGFTFIKAFQDGNTSFKEAEPAVQLLVVNPKATLVIKADNKSIEQNQLITLSYSVSGFKKSETISVLSGKPDFKAIPENQPAGSYPIFISRGSLTATNYDLDLQDGILTILNGTLTPVVMDKDSLIKIYPNPATDNLVIEIPDETMQMNIYDANGKLMIKKQLGNSVNHTSVKHLSEGIYIVSIQTDKFLIQKKLFIKR